MPRKHDACMFCTDDEPCDSHRPKAKKASTPKRKPPALKPEPVVEAAPALPKGNALDLKAAMKKAAQETASPDQFKPVSHARRAVPTSDALVDLGEHDRNNLKATIQKAAAESAAKGPEYLPTTAVHVRVKHQTGAPVDTELMQAIAVLEPILHPSELRNYEKITRLPAYRALRWKLKNRGNSD